MEPCADILGKRDRLRIAEDLNGFARGIHNEPAIGAAGKVQFEILPNAGIKHSVEIVCKLENNFLAVHCTWLRRKYLFSFSRSFNLARNNRDFTAASVMPNA